MATHDGKADTDRLSQRTAAHYAWAVVVLGVYGGQVCPYVEGLNAGYWIMLLAVFFIALFALRHAAIKGFVLGAPYERMVKAQLVFEIILFIGVSAAITIFNFVRHGFPVESGLKIMVGVITLGFFASVDLALARERAVARHFALTGKALEPSGRQFPITRKFLLLSVISILLFATVIFLVLSKDLAWLSELGHQDQARARWAVLGELSFIAFVIVGGLVNLALSYSRNLAFFFDNENASLMAVASGDFSRRVTLSTNDEFGTMAWYTNKMIEDLSRTLDELKRTQDATIHSLASLAEIRDMETGLHIVRTKLYVKALATELARNPVYGKTLTPDVIDLMHKSAPLHDIGKVGIPDAVLLKPARLTPEEFAIMKTHPVLGGNALGEAEKVLGASSFLTLAREIAYNHHEKWDGSGYPRGLKGQDIPLSGRLMALADVYDALVFKRVYKPAISHSETRAIILEDRGKHFDPDVVDAFLAIEDTFVAIAEQYAEGTVSPGAVPPDA